MHPYRFVVHDRDSIFSPSLDWTLNDFGVRVIRTPVQGPTANAFCERLIGTIRRECLDYLIPLSERHLRLTLREFVAFYNRGRPHSALGPGTPEPIQPGCSGERPQASASRRSPNHIQAGPWWIARLSAGKGGRLTSDGIVADHTGVKTRSQLVRVALEGSLGRAQQLMSLRSKQMTTTSQSHG